MRLLTASLALSSFLLCWGALPASAQTPISFGAQLNFADDFDFGIGAHLVAGTSTVVENSRVVASFDYYFPDGGDGVDFSFWEINLNAHYLFPLENAPVGVYAGAGIHIYNVSVDFDGDEDFGFGGFGADDSGAGLNLLGGVDFRTAGSLSPFAELKIELGGAEQFVLTGGVRF